MDTMHSHYLDYLYIKDMLKEYASPKSKLTTMIQSGEIIRIRKGLYIDKRTEDYSIKTLANKIYGPSYISYEYALAHYGIIPERAVTVTSAVFNKNKNRRFKTPLGTFVYYYTNPGVYPYGITQKVENGQPYLIATREKALCDLLYKTKGVTSAEHLAHYLFDDMRMDHEQIHDLNREDLTFFEGIFRRKTITLFVQSLLAGSLHA